MRRILIALLMLGSFASWRSLGEDAPSGRIIKVLPFYLDLQGREAKSPSLFDRDAYQAYLREHTNEISAIRFDIQWKATKAPDENLKIRLELRGVGDQGMPMVKTMETNAPPGIFHDWTMLTLGGEERKKFGAVVAWRASLWNGDQLFGDQTSFLW